MAKETVMVAGGAGFVGAYVVEKLLESGKQVIVVDNCSRGQIANLPDGCSVIQEDIRLLKTRLRGFIQEYGVTTLYDFAARVYGVKDLYKDPAELLVDNVEMTTTLLQNATAGITNYVYISSSCVYDFKGAKVPHIETDLKPCDTSYGWSKLFGEALVRFFAQQYGFEYRVLRLFNVFGPRDSFVSPHVIPDFIRAAWAVKQGLTTSFPVIGSGKQSRDFTWIDDAAAGIIAVAEKGKHGEAYNIGTGREITVLDLARMVCQLMDVEPTFIHVEAPKEDIQRRSAGVAKVQADTGWAPEVSLEAGLQRVIDWLVPRLESGAAPAPKVIAA